MFMHVIKFKIKKPAQFQTAQKAYKRGGIVSTKIKVKIQNILTRFFAGK